MRIDLQNQKEFSSLFSNILKKEKKYLINGISLDSRNIKKNDLFVALDGEKVDGNNFINQAIDSGCSAVLSSKRNLNHLDIPHIIIKNPKEIIGKIAKKWREKFKIDIVGITGSNGKTTTKDLLVHIFSTQKNVHGTIGNYNTDLGLPLTLLQLHKTHSISFLEMGANKIGDISYLCKLSKPNIGIITNISYAHLSTFGSLDNIIKAKFELFEYIAKSGMIFLNNDDKNINTKIKTLNKTTFGFNQNSDYKYEKIINDKGEITLKVKKQIIKTFFNNPILIKNILAAITIASSLGISWYNIKKSILSFKQPEGRCSTYYKNGITIIDDTYNANLSSTLGALLFLSNLKSEGKKIMVFGDMLELGTKSKNHHIEVGKQISNSNINHLVTLGDQSKITFKNSSGIEKYHFENKNQLIEHLKKNIQKGDAVLFKASRGMSFDLLINGVFKS